MADFDPFSEGSGNEPGEHLEEFVPEETMESSQEGFYANDTASHDYAPFGEEDGEETQGMNSTGSNEQMDPMAMYGQQQVANEAEPVQYEHRSIAPDEIANETMAKIPEDNALTQFMAEFEKQIAEKAVEQEKVAQESKAKAQEDLANFLEQREKMKESKKSSNRVHEQATLEKLTADMECENPWERVVTLVELDAQNRKKKNNEKKEEAAVAAANSNDKKKSAHAVLANAVFDEEEDGNRMKQIFLKLKSEPLEATRGAVAAAN